MKLLVGIIIAAFAFTASTTTSSADNFEKFKSFWEYYMEECSLAVENPTEYAKGASGAKEKIDVVVSDDKNILHLSKGKGSLHSQTRNKRYVELMVFIYPDREMRACSAFLNGRFKPLKLSPKTRSWLEEKDGYQLTGGLMPLYDKTWHYYGLSGAFPKHNLAATISINKHDIGLGLNRIIRFEPENVSEKKVE